MTLSGKEFWSGEQTNWCCYNYVTYIKLGEETNLDEFEGKLKEIRDQYFVTYERENDPKYADLIEEYNSLIIQHVSDIYLYSGEINGFTPFGDIRIVSIFAVIAIFILLLSCMNFVNLATANSAERVKEIGLRKAVGSGRNGIIQQFLMEAVIMSFISVIMGLLLAAAAVPLFSQVIGRPMVIPFDQPFFISF